MLWKLHNLQAGISSSGKESEKGNFVLVFGNYPVHLPTIYTMTSKSSNAQTCIAMAGLCLWSKHFLLRKPQNNRPHYNQLSYFNNLIHCTGTAPTQRDTAWKRERERKTDRQRQTKMTRETESQTNLLGVWLPGVDRCGCEDFQRDVPLPWTHLQHKYTMLDFAGLCKLLPFNW